MRVLTVCAQSSRRANRVSTRCAAPSAADRAARASDGHPIALRQRIVPPVRNIRCAMAAAMRRMVQLRSHRSSRPARRDDRRVHDSRRSATGYTRRANSSFERRRPRVVRRTRGSGAVERLEEPGVERPRRGAAPSGPASASASGEARVQPQARGSSPRRPRPPASTASAPPGGSAGAAPSAGASAARYPSSRAAFQRRVAPSNAWAPGPDRLVRPPRPVGEVVPALVARAAPSSRSRSRGSRPRRAGPPPARTAPPPGRRPARRSPPPASAARPAVVGRWSPSGPVSPSASGSSSVSAYAETWSGAEGQRGVQRRAPRPPRSGPGTSYSRSSETDAIPAVARLADRRRRRPPAGGAAPAAAAAPRRTTGRPARAG